MAWKSGRTAHRDYAAYDPSCYLCPEMLGPEMRAILKYLSRFVLTMIIPPFADTPPREIDESG